MSEPVKILAWKTTDGQIHESEGTASLHQKDLDMKSRLADIVDQFYFHGMTKDELVEDLLSHSVDLRTALGG
jgi:hypothetical protein